MRQVAVSSVKDTKKFPRGLHIALDEIEKGKEIGPFNSVEEFMVGLK